MFEILGFTKITVKSIGLKLGLSVFLVFFVVVVVFLLLFYYYYLFLFFF